MDVSEYTFEVRDQWGNLLYCNNGKVFLKLATENGRVRKIGEIFYYKYKMKDGSEQELLTYAKEEDSRQIFRKLNAWSICWEVLQRVQMVVYFTKERAYQIRIWDPKDTGIFKHFKGSGIEKKVYIPLDMWKVKNYKAK